LLRRKNIAEALLLTRWLRPEAWLVTTGGVTSKDEQPYADHLAAAVREHGWPLRLGVLAGDESRKPSVAALLAVSECVLLTSVQEGFGLPYLEAAAARRPLIARSLSNVSPDLRRFGFHFPQGYEEILVSTDLFNWTAERRRQQRVFARWRAQLPPGLNHDVQRPVWCESSAAPDSIPFSRLTLAAQIEVLAAPLELSWQRCVALNPFLESWRRRAGNGSLQISPWPRAAARWLSGRAWAKRFWVLAKDRPASSTRIPASRRAHEELLRTKLSAANLYPLLCSTSVAA
jgi:hypothetical protein